MSEITAVSAEAMKLYNNIAQKMQSVIGAAAAPDNDPKTQQEARDAGVASRTTANGRAPGDESVYVAIRELGLSVAYERSVHRRVRSRLNALAAARARAMAKSGFVKTGLPEGLV